MSVVDFSVHHVTKITVVNRMLSTTFVQILKVEYTDYHGNEQETEINLYTADGKPLICEVPEEVAEAESVEVPLPPSLEAEIERDTQAAIGMGKVWGHVLDTLLSPKAAT